MRTNLIGITNMSILYSSIHRDTIYQKPEMKEKPKKVEKVSKGNGGHFDVRR